MKRLWGRKVSDLSFRQFVEILKYKCQKHKRQFIQIGQWICSECGSHHDRDINAAINILRAARGPSVEKVSDASSETLLFTKHKPPPLGGGCLDFA